MDEFTIRAPDDFHVHLREGSLLRDVATFTSSSFRRALVMPNTQVPILTGNDAVRYREEILARTGMGFEPLMTIKLVSSTTPDVVHAAKSLGVVAGKLYPEGVTTNSEDGVANLESMWDVFSAMEECGMVLSLHGETPGVFCMDRETTFLRDLRRISMCFPNLKVVLEHITTSAAVHAILDLPDNVSATITAHHLVLTLDDVVGGLLDPHSFCKPIAKTPQDRFTLRLAATRFSSRFFFGSDSAPHLRGKKECAGGCAGVFSAPCAIEVLATVFEEELCADERLFVDSLEAFVSRTGASFYGLPPNDGFITLVREDWTVPPLVIGIEGPRLVPFMAGMTLPWRFSGFDPV